ncbi:16S rRNA (uracil(1498)-N(3))-methyltransferase [Virgibacillus sp. W0430]|uniref:16S rRNA (uracil(1498)-N(3))-methyltransferase n=1 Tax=Virgibacillus sp. W0430 TaxID=3391580 RepID=UPI003F453E18
MQRYFLQEDSWKANNVSIEDEDAHHIINVMRSKINDEIICCHPNGKAARCRLLSFENNRVIGSIIEWLDSNKESPIKVTIAQGLPKGDKFELVLQKGTELGAWGFIPFQAERSVVNWDKRKTEKKVKRYARIVKEASEQSERNFIPFVQKPVSLSKLIADSKTYTIKLVAYENEAKQATYQSLATELKKLKSGDSLLVCIGPEGGFSDKEINTLKANDFVPVRFGPRILRTETAALYLLSSISYHFEELGC